MTTLAITPISSVLCHALPVFASAQSGPVSAQHTVDERNNIECFASTGVNTPGTISPTRQGSSPLRNRRKAPTIRGRLRWDADAANGPKADENPLASGGGYKGVI